MRLVFCGTPQFAVPTLERLRLMGHEIALVVTQPDRPKGRGMEVFVSAVKQRSLEFGLPVAQPERIRNNVEFREQLEAISPEVIIVVAYGRIIPRWMLDLPAHGNLNLHGSLLPKYRGAAPIQWAIADGESVTGNTVICLDEGLDTGDILLMREVPIAETDTTLTLAPRLAADGAELMAEVLARFDTLVPRKQDNTQATLASILSKEDGAIDFERTARQIHDRFRGFQPWPGAYTRFRGKTLALRGCHVSDEPGTDAQPGTLLIEHNGDLSVHCGRATLLVLDAIQIEGKKALSAREFVNGYQLRSGEVLGQ